MKNKNNGYQIWPVYYGHEVKYRVVKFVSGEVAYERQFRKRTEADEYVIEVLRRANRPPINDMIDEGGPVHPTEYDESDDLEAAKRLEEDDEDWRKGSIWEKRSVSQELMDELEPIQTEMDYSGAFESDVEE